MGTSYIQIFNKKNILGLGITYFAYCYSKFLKLSFVLEFSDDGIKNVENIKKLKKVM